MIEVGTTAALCGAGQIHIATSDECQVAVCTNAPALIVDIVNGGDSYSSTTDVATVIIEIARINFNGAAPNNRP